MKKICCYSALSLPVLLSGCIVAPPRQQVVVPQQVQAVTPLGIEDVTALSKAGLGEDLIIGQIRSSATVYHLGTADIIALKTAGVSEKVIDYMINTPGTATPPPTAVVQQYAPVPQTVVVQPGPAYVVAAPVVYPVCPLFWPFWGWGWHGHWR